MLSRYVLLKVECLVMIIALSKGGYRIEDTCETFSNNIKYYLRIQHFTIHPPNH